MTLAILGVGPIFSSTVAGGAANPQLQFFENFPGKDLVANVAYSKGTLSVHAVNIPLSLSFGYPVVLLSNSSSGGTRSIQFGLYSLNGNTLSLANSASNSWAPSTSAYSWISLITSATQNITPGAWYFALNLLSAGNSSFSLLGNSSINPGNAAPAFVRGRMTASTTAMPASIATSALDITGQDAMRQPYIIITA